MCCGDWCGLDCMLLLLLLWILVHNWLLPVFIFIFFLVCKNVLFLLVFFFKFSFFHLSYWFSCLFFSYFNFLRIFFRISFFFFQCWASSLEHVPLNECYLFIKKSFLLQFVFFNINSMTIHLLFSHVTSQIVFV